MPQLLMATLIVAAGLPLTLLATVPATAEIWCLRTPGESGGVCAFPFGRDCARAAAYMSYGGVCERQPLPDQTKRGAKQRIGRTAADWQQ
jgi:hypothetical protein